MVYTPDQMAGAKEGIDLAQTSMIELDRSVNLGSMLTAGWVTPPSALAPVQATRYLMISDAVLAPVGLGADIMPLDLALADCVVRDRLGFRRGRRRCDPLG